MQGIPITGRRFIVGTSLLPCGVALVLCAEFFVLPLANVPALRSILALTTMLGGSALVLREKRRLPPSAWLLVAWCLLGFASTFWSLDPEATAKRAFYDMLLPAGVFIAAWRAALEPRHFARMRWAASLGVIFIAIVALYAAAARDPASLLPGGTGVHYWPGVGVASTFAVLATPFALFALCADKNEERALGSVLLAAVIVIALFSQNRAAWPAMFVTALAFTAWHWPALAKKSRVVVATSLVAAALAGFVAFRFTIAERLVDAPGKIAAHGLLGSLASDPRLQGWREWVQIAAHAPVGGYGFGMPIVHSVGESSLSAAVKARDSFLAWHAHNVLLDVVVQLGFVGLLVFCALLATLIWEYGSLARRSTAEGRWRTAALGFALLVAMLAKNSTDDFMEHAVVIAYWGYAGMALGGLAGITAASRGKSPD